MSFNWEPQGHLSVSGPVSSSLVLSICVGTGGYIGTYLQQRALGAILGQALEGRSLVRGELMAPIFSSEGVVVSVSSKQEVVVRGSSDFLLLWPGQCVG